MSKCILLEEAEKLLNDKIEHSHWADKTKIYKEILMEIESLPTIELSENDILPKIEKKITKKGKLKVIVHATPENPLVINQHLLNNI